ncbi:PREDICTED: receptor-type [Prunus dulcis]|uniref:PREDICTED: receptor-type n=1 Tax=Prunus dulcis TaxID=3755 RepID=A0A5E4E8H1_PRUDU|nr:PREDICTED: receptor-type [Prunus dulcis]
MPKTKRMREMLKTKVDDVTAWGKSQKLENISSRGSPHHRRSPSMATAATNAIPSLELLAYDRPPRRLTLAPHQYKYCSLALKFFKDKLRMPEQIKQEWDHKNRYDDYVALDENRVVLNYSAAGDYINASFITSCSSSFIATQGPLSETFEDFWEMVIQYRCSVVVMLTDLDDNKCGDYFQAEGDDGHREFGNISIATKSIRSSEFGDGNSVVLRLLEVKKHKEESDSEEAPISVLHIQYPQWPDHGVPENTIAVREILKRAMYQVAPAIPDSGPIVVHCSAGVGRTGTYCTNS